VEVKNLPLVLLITFTISVLEAFTTGNFLLCTIAFGVTGATLVAVAFLAVIFLGAAVVFVFDIEPFDFCFCE
jgi:hypothetical protein